MNSFEDVIAAFDGPTKFAAAIGIPAFHAQTMKNRDSIPPAYWPDVIKAAAERSIDGVTADSLMALAAAKRRSPESSEAAA